MLEELSHDKLLKVLHYEPSTGVFTWKERPSKRIFSGTQAGYVGSQGYRYISILGKKYLEHRIAWFYVHGKMPEKLIDHINHNRADNRIANLRQVSIQDNARNRKRNNQSRTQEMGVHYDKRSKRFVAQIRVNGKKVFQRYFKTADEAIEARKAQAKLLGFHDNHGE